MKTVPEEFAEKAKLYAKRNAAYGGNYKRFGDLMMVLFPVGIELTNPADHNRFALFVHIATRLTRYAEQFDRGGHDDSLDDIAVYSMMLKEVDALRREAIAEQEHFQKRQAQGRDWLAEADDIAAGSPTDGSIYAEASRRAFERAISGENDPPIAEKLSAALYTGKAPRSFPTPVPASGSQPFPMAPVFFDNSEGGEQ
jgi:hypothetical protein